MAYLSPLLGNYGIVPGDIPVIVGLCRGQEAAEVGALLVVHACCTGSLEVISYRSVRIPAIGVRALIVMLA